MDEMTYPTKFYWNGPGWYAGTSDEYGSERFLVGWTGKPLNEVNQYCRDRLYDTPRLYLEKPEAKDGLWFPDIDPADLFPWAIKEQD